MENELEFHWNAAVLAANRLQIGHVERVVVDSDRHTLTHIVVRTGALFSKQEKVVPIGMVAETSPDQVVLTPEAGDLESALAFEEERVIAVTGESPESNSGPPASMGPLPAVYGAPVMGTPLPPNAGEPYKTETEQNIPEGTVALKEGARVVNDEGKPVGTADAVRVEAPGDQVTHFLVSQGLLTKESRWVPVDFVRAIQEDQIDLKPGREASLEDLETI